MRKLIFWLQNGGSTYTRVNTVNDLISLNSGHSQWRLYLSRVNCQEKIILHKNIQLEAKILGKILNLEKMCKIPHISETHALIQVSDL